MPWVTSLILPSIGNHASINNFITRHFNDFHLWMVFKDSHYLFASSMSEYTYFRPSYFYIPSSFFLFFNFFFWKSYITKHSYVLTRNKSFPNCSVQNNPKMPLLSVDNCLDFWKTIFKSLLEISIINNSPLRNPTARRFGFFVENFKHVMSDFSNS